MTAIKRLVILSGPSCVGKTPMLKALKRIYPHIKFGRFILYSSRKPRLNERDGVDFHFRPVHEIMAMPNNQFIAGRVRNLWQAIDLEKVKKTFQEHQLIIVEIHPSLATLFQTHPAVKQLSSDFETRTVFISPLTNDEIKVVQKKMAFSTPEETVATIMTPKLITRSLRQGKLLTPDELKDIQIRTSKAYEEIQIGQSYTDFIVNHDGEDSNNWYFSPPIGDAGKTLKSFVKIITK